MTTELDGIAVSTESLAPDIVSQIASSAMSLDQGERDTRANIELLARSGILGLGAPRNHDRALPTMAAVIAELAGHCLSTAFSVWAHRMTIEYLTEAATPWSRERIRQPDRRRRAGCDRDGLGVQGRRRVRHPGLGGDACRPGLPAHRHTALGQQSLFRFRLW